jgi:hypothetical protein
VLLRRLRGLMISMLLWSAPWAAFGALIGVAYLLGLFPGTVIRGPAIPGGLPVTLGLAGAIVGAVNGLVFGVLIMIAERKHAVSELRASRIGAWAAVATGGTVLMISQVPLVAAACGVIGFLAGVLALRAAQREGRADATRLDAAT